MRQFVISTTDLNHAIFMLFSHSISSKLRGPVLPIKSIKLVFFMYFSEFLAASGWEGKIQLHFDTSNGLGGTIKRLNI